MKTASSEETQTADIVKLASSVTLGCLADTALKGLEEDFFRSYTPAGVTLFSRNIAGTSSQFKSTESSNKAVAAQLTELLVRLQATRPSCSPPLLIAIDQEGGRVSRLKGLVTDYGPASEVADGKSDEQSLGRILKYAQELGLQLLDLGINCNFAPVLDVLSNPKNDAIGDRSWGCGPEQVMKRAKAFQDGHRDSGVITCLKHFPGQGAASKDTHLTGASIGKSARDLLEMDIAPFKELLPSAPMVMLSHCSYPSLEKDESKLLEACKSPSIATYLLKQCLNYNGVVVSDDMTMGAISQQNIGEDAIHAINAGVDLLLICKGLDKWRDTIECLSIEAENNPIFRLRLQQASNKVGQLRNSLK